ncbi:lytic polysaccharide monooxygenase [Aquimonas sp.]|jgi:chitin-binding protein|uniref:lytic polysaccharide monooxygenase n=1 Tax=Aquimonas sp. TaxID=1872588 RepID=UPI0037BEF4AD
MSANKPLIHPMALSLFALTVGLAVAPAQVAAHGSMSVPASRVYYCAQGNIENPADPACRAHVQQFGTQAFYNWNGVNQANAAGNHRAVVPDGKLCSGNNGMFQGLDAVRDWKAQPIAPDASGRFQFEFRAPAAHSTRDWIFYITRAGWDGSRALRWDDLEEFCRLGNVPLSPGNIYRMNCPLPQRAGRHVIYNVWQRSDSTEAFYTCVDVEFTGGVNTTWAELGALSAQNALPEGSTVSLRLFNAQGGDVGRVSHRVAAGQGAASEWPYHFALTVNQTSGDARIGVLEASGQIVPQRSATANRVFARRTLNLNHQIDIQLPDVGVLPPVSRISASTTAVVGAGVDELSAAQSSDPAGRPLSYSWSLLSGAGQLSSETGVSTRLTLANPSSAQTLQLRLRASNGTASADATVSIQHSPATGGGDYDHVYPQGLGTYQAGQTVVLGSDGQRYRCRPFPNGGWCNISGTAYAPGSGWAWQDAWTRL